jgi:hypothetical protein
MITFNHEIDTQKSHAALCRQMTCSLRRETPSISDEEFEKMSWRARGYSWKYYYGSTFKIGDRTFEIRWCDGYIILFRVYGKLVRVWMVREIELFSTDIFYHDRCIWKNMFKRHESIVYQPVAILDPFIFFAEEIANCEISTVIMYEQPIVVTPIVYGFTSHYFNLTISAKKINDVVRYIKNIFN